jgi:uncharacterized protein
MNINLKKLASFCTILTIATVNCTAVSSLAKEVNNKPKQQELLLWKIEPKSGSNYSTYILGSYHIGKSCQLQSPDLESALNEAEEVIFEVDANSSDISQIQLSIIDAIRYKGIPENSKDSLVNVLKPETYKLLAKKSQAMGLPLDNLAYLRPWVFMFMLQSSTLAKTNYKPQCGIESMILDRLRSKNKKTSGLETESYQIELIMSLYEKMDVQDIINAIQEIVKQKDTSQVLSEFNSQLDELTSSINSGDLETFEKSVNTMCQNSLEDCDRLLTQRNKNWIPKIEKIITDTKDNLIVVGAGHLVGKEGVIKLLQSKGYNVRRVNSNFQLTKTKM